jgi:hypothetical protein
MVGGGLLLTLTLYGVVLGILRARGSADFARRRAITLLILAPTVQALGLVAWVPLAFQRYTLPLVPFLSLWAAYGLSQVLRLAKGSAWPWAAE